MSDRKQFTIGHVENIVQRSKEIGSDKPLVVGVREADVTCACGHKWTADERNGLRSVMGGVHITCPSCGASDVVHARILRA